MVYVSLRRSRRGLSAPRSHTPIAYVDDAKSMCCGTRKDLEYGNKIGVYVHAVAALKYVELGIMGARSIRPSLQLRDVY